MKESLRQCIRPLGRDQSPGHDEIRRAPVLLNRRTGLQKDGSNPLWQKSDFTFSSPHNQKTSDLSRSPSNKRYRAKRQPVMPFNSTANALSSFRSSASCRAFTLPSQLGSSHSGSGQSMPSPARHSGQSHSQSASLRSKAFKVRSMLRRLVEVGGGHFSRSISIQSDSRKARVLRRRDPNPAKR
jgi:hypothetical protein